MEKFLMIIMQKKLMNRNIFIPNNINFIILANIEIGLASYYKCLSFFVHKSIFSYFIIYDNFCHFLGGFLLEKGF